MWTRTNYMSDIKKRTPPMLQRQYWHSRSDTHTLAHSLTHTHSLSLSHIHTHKHTHDNIIIAWHIKLILMALRQSPFKAILILSLSISFHFHAPLKEWDKYFAVAVFSDRSVTNCHKVSHISMSTKSFLTHLFH